MVQSLLDRRTDQLGKACYNIRQNIDVFRLIAINVDRLREVGASESFWGHTQFQAQVSIAVALAAVFESEDERFTLCSIPAIILSLPHEWPTQDRFRFEKLIKKFGGKWNGGSKRSSSARDTVWSSYLEMKMKHSASIKQLIAIRNKRACHLELPEPGKLEVLFPSFDQLEQLWLYAVSVYEILHHEFNGAGPALMSKHVQVGLTRTFEALGVGEPQLDFLD